MLPTGVGPRIMKTFVDDAVGDERYTKPASGLGVRERSGRLFLAVVAVYTVGLIFWLVLGLLPTLANAFVPIHHWAETVAASSSPLAGPAGRILNANQSMPGMNLEATGVSSVVLAYCFSALNLTLGLILVALRPKDLVPRLLALAFLGTAATFNKPSHAVFHIIGEPWPVKVVHFGFHIVSGVAYLWAVLLFPDGRLPRQIRLEGPPLAIVAGVITVVVSVISWRGSFVNHPEFFVVFFGVVVSVAGIAAQTLRVADPQALPSDRRSSRLLAAALLPAFFTGLVWLGARAVVLAGGPAGRRAEHLDRALQSAFPAVFAIVPVVLFVGILRYRLWDMDWLLSRALLYGSLAVAVAALYVIAVSLVDSLLGKSLWSTVIVLSVVSLTVELLWRGLRRCSNWAVYGQVMSPTDALRTMLAGLERLAPAVELQQLTRVVVEATRAVRSRLWLVSGDQRRLAASFPDGTETADSSPETARTDGLGRVTIPIRYKGQSQGNLEVALPPGAVLSSSDSMLVESLASHAGVIVHNAALNVELARRVATLSEQVDELRASRRRLVAAQDNERRKLERDLHDGAQQSLVAVLIELRTATVLLSAPGHQHREAAELSDLLTQTGTMLEELVSDEGPSVLAQRGLVGAVSAAGALSGRAGPLVRVNGTRGRGPAARHRRRGLLLSPRGPPERDQARSRHRGEHRYRRKRGCRRVRSERRRAGFRPQPDRPGIGSGQPVGPADRPRRGRRY